MSNKSDRLLPTKVAKNRVLVRRLLNLPIPRRLVLVPKSLQALNRNPPPLDLEILSRRSLVPRICLTGRQLNRVDLSVEVVEIV